MTYLIKIIFGLGVLYFLWKKKKVPDPEISEQEEIEESLIGKFMQPDNLEFFENDILDPAEPAILPEGLSLIEKLDLTKTAIPKNGYNYQAAEIQQGFNVLKELSQAPAITLVLTNVSSDEQAINVLKSDNAFDPDLQTGAEVYGLLDFDGVNDLIKLDSAPDMRYKKWVTFNCYLLADSGFDTNGLFFFDLGTSAVDKLSVGLRDNYLYICPGTGLANVVSYDITGLANKILTIQIIKEDIAGLGKVLNLIINDENKPIANPGGYGIVNGDGDLIGAFTTLTGFLGNALIWDIVIKKPA